MRKLLLFLMLSISVTLITACSSDDDKGGTSEKQLTIFSDATGYFTDKGASVTFTALVKEGEDLVEIESGVSFYVDGIESENPYTFDRAGEFKVIAKKKGYIESEPLIIRVKEEAVKTLELTIVSDTNEIYVNGDINLRIKDGNGVPINGAELYLDGVATGITSIDGEYGIVLRNTGSFELKVVHEGITSNVLNVTVKRDPSSGNVGRFTFASQIFDITDSYLGLTGIYYTDATQTKLVATWQLEGLSEEDVTAIIMFQTPAKSTGGGNYSFEKPTLTNNTVTGIVVFSGMTIMGSSVNNLSFEFDAIPTSSTIYTGEYTASAPDLGVSSFNIYYGGLTYYIDRRNEGSTASKSNIIQSNNNTIKVDHIKTIDSDTMFQLVNNSIK